MRPDILRDRADDQPAGNAVNTDDGNTTLSLVQRLVAAYMQLNVASRAAREVSVNEDLVLLHLAMGPATSADLCRRIGITSASMTNIVAGLEARGLLRRLPDATDGRRILLYASKSAIASLDDEDIDRQLEALLGEFEPSDRRAIDRFLARAVDVLIP
jgi:DNA-binding MarR family transcriptional regulator